MRLRIGSWNVNSLRAAKEKGFLSWLEKENQDIICLQEVRAMEADLRPLESQFRGYRAYWHPAVKPGYAGVAILTRFKIKNIERGLNDTPDPEGRAITIDFGDFRVGSFYAPNAVPGTEKIAQKITWIQNASEHVMRRNDKPFFICGDFNVAHTEKDSQGIAHPKHMNGCTDEERKTLSSFFTKCDLTDPMREQCGDSTLSTWWGVPPSLRSMFNGIRYDYILLQRRYQSLIENPLIYINTDGSDHCPIGLSANVAIAELETTQNAGQRSFFQIQKRLH